MIYNDEKFHSWLAHKTPAEIYFGRRELKKLRYIGNTSLVLEKISD